jgi:hypothetical protein
MDWGAWDGDMGDTPQVYAFFPLSFNNSDDITD